TPGSCGDPTTEAPAEHADLGDGNGDVTPEDSTVKGGCAMGGGASCGQWLGLVALGLALGLRARRRR
ncbi:MAG: hypothetical protein ACXVEE_44030, partial [Polyangiales bacterium]